MRRFSFFLLVILVLSACQNSDDDVVLTPSQLYGSWVQIQYNENLVTMGKQENLPENNYGFTFKTKGAFIERKNSGWCGTPPIVYGDFDGTWSANDSIILISVGYWGGISKYTWKIVELTESTFVFEILQANYQSGD